MTKPITLTKKHLRAVKLGKLFGSTVRGDCPEGDVEIDGHVAGSWTADSQDEAATTGHRYRVYGYSATVEIGGNDVSFEVIREGVTKRQRKTHLDSRCYSFGNDLEPAATAKARLRRQIAKALAAHEAKLENERVKRQLERQTGLPQGALDEPNYVAVSTWGGVHRAITAQPVTWDEAQARRGSKRNSQVVPAKEAIERGLIVDPADLQRTEGTTLLGGVPTKGDTVLVDGEQAAKVVEVDILDRKVTVEFTSGNRRVFHLESPKPEPFPASTIRRTVVDRVKLDLVDETLARNGIDGEHVVAILEADLGDRLVFHAVQGDTVTRVTVAVTAERI